jgi:electron transport complex protein RnfE
LKKIDILRSGLFKENPTFVQLLGMCPTLATTSSVKNGLGMGLSVTAVLMCANLAISAIRKLVPDKIRIAAYVIVIAGFVTIVDLLLKAFLPELSKSLGIFIPLIVVNCVIFARAESFASKNKVTDSIVDGLAMGLGVTGALVIIASFREIIGNGTWFGLSLFGSSYQPAIMAVLPPGGFIIFGLILGGINLIRLRGKADV